MSETERPAILIVDDEAYNLDLLERTLKRDYEVARAENGQTALDLLPTLPNLALIITDQRMPGRSGLDLLAEVRNTRPEITRVLLSGFSDLPETVPMPSWPT